MTEKRSSILTGTAGAYFVASRLALFGYHAALTHGNAPTVDILVGHIHGNSAVSIQVKTTISALRTRGRHPNKVPDHYEWDVGQKSGTKKAANLFFAFVDLKGGDESSLPDVYVVPSEVIYEAFNRPFFKDPTKRRRWRWHPKVEVVEPYRNKWSILEDALLSQ